MYNLNEKEDFEFAEWFNLAVNYLTVDEFKKIVIDAVHYKVGKKFESGIKRGYWICSYCEGKKDVEIPKWVCPSCVGSINNGNEMLLRKSL